MYFLFRILIGLNFVSSWLIGLGYSRKNLKHEIKQIFHYLKNKKFLAIDIGANQGLYTDALIKKFGKNVEVHVFEPSRYHLPVLIEKFSKLENVFLVPYAIAEISGVTKLFADTHGSGLASLFRRELSHHNIQFNTIEEVNAVRFENYWSDRLNYRDIDFVKIDVEGSELNVLRSFGRAIEHVKIIQFEFGGTSIDAKHFFKDYWTFFEDRGFNLYRLTPFGKMRLNSYSESLERFTYGNYYAIKK